ncbi:MAG: phosphoribosylformylglycinamidine cyclo-ligase [Deferribacteres bacterium]|nr:phosphoribosylformylglycinamidine cyclo-ligase [candidate division KSB1 bacterium]MCB9501224.1 phosphoribosylformylglycinamidine cyclo-ligase [Deferribacteres bacterium]
MNLTYKMAGVDRDAANEVVKRIARLSQKTKMQGVLDGIGHFGAFFELPKDDYKNPVLVSSTDGVGTKIKVACAMNNYGGIGYDIVNHSVNDIMCSGAKPLYFLDYLSVGKIEGSAIMDLAESLVDACDKNSIALIGGETAEMPDLYQPGEFDIAGTIVGIIEKENIINGRKIEKDNILIGLESSGLHTNGFSLVRKIIELSEKASYHKFYDSLGSTLGEALLVPHRSYKDALDPIIHNPAIKGISHITGGGIVENTKRLMYDGMDFTIDWTSWELPAIYSLLQEMGDIETQEMRNVFNLGIGMILIVDKSAENEIMGSLQKTGLRSYIIGKTFLNV